MSDSPTMSWPEKAEGVEDRQEEKEDEVESRQVEVEGVHSGQGELPEVTNGRSGQVNEPSVEVNSGSVLEPVLEDPRDGSRVRYMDATIEPSYDIGELARELAKADEMESRRHVTTRKSGARPTEFKVTTPSKSRSDAEFYRVGMRQSIGGSKVKLAYGLEAEDEEKKSEGKRKELKHDSSGPIIDGRRLAIRAKPRSPESF